MVMILMLFERFEIERDLFNHHHDYNRFSEILELQMNRFDAINQARCSLVSHHKSMLPSES